MILRTAFLLGCTALAYAMLRGWPEGLSGLMRACFAVLAWVAGLGVWTRRRVPENEVAARARRRPRWPDYLALGMALLAVESGFLWLLSAAPRPLEAAGLAIERRFRPEAAALRAVSDENHHGTRRGNWLWSGETRRPLPRRTDFKPGTKPEVFVRLADRADAEALLKGRLYLRAFALGRYADAAWSPTTRTALEIQADASGLVKLAPTSSGRGILHEVFHAADPGGQNVLTALQGVAEARISPLTRIDDGLFLLPPATAAGGYQYLANSRPMRIEDLPDGALVSGWPGAADALLALPEDGNSGGRLRELAHAAAGAGTVKQQLLHLQDHLRTAFAYSLATANPRNLDPMENFLFEEKRGHCEYFATAGALMARALGLPSRVAYGWAGGTWYDSAGLFVFRANEAHAWTEIWLANFGWVLMDPTPQSAGGGERAQVAPPDEPLPGAADDRTAEDSPETDTGTDLPRLGMWLLLGFGIPAACITGWRGRRRFPADPQSPEETAGLPAPGYLKVWRHACGLRGIPLPPGSTLRRQISRLPDLPEFARDMGDYHYGTRYEGKPPDKRVEKQLVRRIRAWEHGFSGIKTAPSPRTRVT